MKRRLIAPLIFALSLSCVAGLSGTGVALAESQDAEWSRIWIAEIVGSEPPLPAEYVHHVGYVQRQIVQVRPIRTVKGPASDAVRSIEHHAFLSGPSGDQLLETGEQVTIYEQAASFTEPAFTLVRRLRKSEDSPSRPDDRP